MSADSKAVVIQMDADARLAAAAGGAARYLADCAGLEGEAVAELQKSVVSACNEAFEHLTGTHAHLNVTITRLADRIEIAVAHEGDLEPAMGLDQIAGFATQNGANVLEGVDRVQFEAHSGLAVTRLTKYLSHARRIA